MFGKGNLLFLVVALAVLIASVGADYVDGA